MFITEIPDILVYIQELIGIQHHVAEIDERRLVGRDVRLLCPCKGQMSLTIQKAERLRELKEQAEADEIVVVTPSLGRDRRIGSYTAIAGAWRGTA